MLKFNFWRKYSFLYAIRLFVLFSIAYTILTASKPKELNHVDLVQLNFRNHSLVFSALLDSINEDKSIAYFRVVKNFKNTTSKTCVVKMPPSKLENNPSMWIVYADYYIKDTLIVDEASLSRSFEQSYVPILANLPHYKYSNETLKIYLNLCRSEAKTNFLYELELLKNLSR